MPQKTFILIVEPSAKERKLIESSLMKEKFRVTSVMTAAEMRVHLADNKVDIIVLALNLPDANGLHLIPKLKDNEAKIIVVSERDNLTDKIVALELGADDYVVKPFEIRELVARVYARARRQKQLQKYKEQIEILQHEKEEYAEKIKFGNWILDRTQWQVYDEEGNSADLTPREFRVLEILVLENNRVLTRGQLLDRAWQDGNNTTDRAVDIQILRIRRKINDSSVEAPMIKAIRDVGYQLATRVKNLN